MKVWSIVERGTAPAAKGGGEADRREERAHRRVSLEIAAKAKELGESEAI